MTREIIEARLKEIAEQKRDWPDGPWQSEPDREDFRAHGLPCFVQRGPLGFWCGYVGVQPGHPMYGKGVGEDETEALEAHGGITYAAACAGHVCHVPEPGEPDTVWWFGFDCGHAFDLTPSFMKTMAGMKGLSDIAVELGAKIGFFGGTYRDLSYVRAQAESLAAQLAEIKPEK